MIALCVGELAGFRRAGDALYEHVIREVVAEGSAMSEQMATHLDVLSIAKNLERIADHATNVAEDVVFLLTGEIVRHRLADGDPPDKLPAHDPQNPT